MRKLNLVGERYSNLVVLHEDASWHKGSSRWVCKCDCGNEKPVLACHLRRGKIVSCGCYRKKINATLHTTHGKAQDNGVRSPVYKSWASMKSRCSRPDYSYYHRYGGRGIRVCDRWQKFENFYADMGDKPEGHSIERLDVDGNYEPGNCKWANDAEQAINRPLGEYERRVDASRNCLRNPERPIQDRFESQEDGLQAVALKSEGI